MSSSREESPDWIRSFQAPNQSVLTLSSGSESPIDDDPTGDDEDEITLSKLFKKDPEIGDNQNGKESMVLKSSRAESQIKEKNAEQTPGRKRKREDHLLEKEEKKDSARVVKGKALLKPKPQEQNPSVLTLSSDSESSPATSPVRNDHHKELCANHEVQHVEEEGQVAVIDNGAVPPRERAMKSPKKQLKKNDYKFKKEKEESDVVIEENNGEIDTREEDTSGKHEGPQVSSSRLPLILSEKVQRSKALVECEGDSIDLSGDVGAVGRVVINESPSGDYDMFLDLKGTIYKTTIVPSRTFCVVSFGQSEAKIESIMNDFIQLKSQSNVYEAETMVEGTLDGFFFDSEDEVENQPLATGQNEKNEAGEEQPKRKTKGKAEKTRGAVGKKAKTAGVKPSKKVKKKTQVPKRNKTKK